MRVSVCARACRLPPQGFPSKPRVGEISEAEADEADARRAAEAQQSMVNLAVAWGLVVLCCSHHFGHLLHAMGYHQYAHGQLMSLMGSPAVSGAIGAFALLGPGRRCAAGRRAETHA